MRTALLLLVAACAHPPPPAAPQEMVPANSLDRSKLEDPPPDDGSLATPDPEPVPVRVEAPKKGAGAKAECGRAMDRYLELEIATNPALKGVPPEIVAQAKEQAKQQHGEAPCTATPAQLRCAIAATTTAAWQKCMK